MAPRLPWYVCTHGHTTAAKAVFLEKSTAPSRAALVRIVLVPSPSFRGGNLHA
jgi:hypothetical protein